MRRGPMTGRGAVTRRGPGLLGTMARTAVVAGTASAVSGGVRRRQDERAQRAADSAAPAADGRPSDTARYDNGPPPAAVSGPPAEDLTAKLGQLADLRAAGALSDAEFAAAKARLLG